jgi:hypothetical protein
MFSKKQIINTIGTLVSTAFVCTAIGLFIAGYTCTYNNKTTVSGDCQNIYIAGILMLFIVGTCLVFALLAYIADRCEIPPQQEAEPPVVVRVQPKKINKAKRPLTTNILHKTLTEESARALTQALEKAVKNPIKVKRKTPLTSVVEDN